MPSMSKRQKEVAGLIHPDTKLSHWRDWKWQLRHSIKDISTFERLLGVKLKKDKRIVLEKTTDRFPLSITPYYASLIDTKDLENDPVYKQSFPSPLELQHERSDMPDPLHEDQDSPVPWLTHRYPDRVLLHVSKVCSMYCRHCTRKRRVGDVDSIPSRREVAAGLDYIRRTPQIRDVLLSGGDPFMLSDALLDEILTELGNIDHVEVVRIGTRTPVVMPQRINNA